MIGREPLSAPVRLLLVEDGVLLRSALVGMLSAERDVHVVAALSGTDPVADAAVAHAADLAVLGVDDPTSPCLDAIRDLRRRRPTCRVIALTMPDVPAVFAALFAAPVHAVVDKYAPAERLLSAIRVVAQGGTVFPRDIMDAVLRARQNPFTPRERQVLRLAAAGATTTQIARELNLTQGTVRNYLSSVITKADAQTRIDAIRTARKFGWL